MPGSFIVVHPVTKVLEEPTWLVGITIPPNRANKQVNINNSIVFKLQRVSCSFGFGNFVSTENRPVIDELLQLVEIHFIWRVFRSCIDGVWAHTCMSGPN